MTATLTPEKYDDVTEALKDVMDPELGINVVDLGLIYDLSWDDENDALVIHMTLTSAGCPLVFKFLMCVAVPAPMSSTSSCVIRSGSRISNVPAGSRTTPPVAGRASIAACRLG